MILNRQAVRLLFVVAFLLPGCGKSRVPVHPVSGQVRVDGEPAEGISVVFHPVGESSTNQVVAQPPGKPVGRTGQDGSFRLTTYDSEDGAPAGDYAVTFSWSAPTIPDKLGGAYREPETSEFQVTVTEGENKLEPFELKAPKQPRRGQRDDPRPAAER